MKIRLYNGFKQGAANLKAQYSKSIYKFERMPLQAAEKIMARSIEMCPEDTGTLISTAYIKELKRGIVTTYEFGYTGDAVNPNTGIKASQYMVKVHEDLSAYHNKGSAKYLEKAVIEYATQEFHELVRKNGGK